MIHHYPLWPAILVKLPSNIPKFDSKPSENPKNHVMTFHLWCSSNFSNGWIDPSTIIPENPRGCCKMVYRATPTLFIAFQCFKNGSFNPLLVTNLV